MNKPPKSTGTGSDSPAEEKRLSLRQKRDLRKQLKAGAIANAERDLVMAKEWCHVEEEVWQKWGDRRVKPC